MSSIDRLTRRAGQRYRANRKEIQEAAALLGLLCVLVFAIALAGGNSLLLAAVAGLSGFGAGLTLVVVLILAISRRR